MSKYLLDSNIIIKFWEYDYDKLRSILNENSIVVLEEVLQELSVKEKRKYKGNYILSERLCELLSFQIKVNKNDISGFYLIFDCEAKEKNISNNLSKVDLLMLYTCYVNNNFILVTEDKELFSISKEFLGEDRVYKYDRLKETYYLD